MKIQFAVPRSFGGRAIATLLVAAAQTTLFTPSRTHSRQAVMLRGKWSTFGCILFLLCDTAQGQVIPPRPIFPAPLSPRIANYSIDVTLDDRLKMLHGAETLVWHNPSGETVSELRFHLYLNGFKNSVSTFMTESNRQQGTAGIPDEERGWINVDAIRTQDGENLKPAMEYIHPDDDNVNDRTVFRLPLKTPVRPGASVTLSIDFTARLPAVVARTGYNHDFFMVGQWFPKIGVYETPGMRYERHGAWNCHQFHANSEFYADFGVYDVRITVPRRFEVGAVGSLVGEIANGDTAKTLTFHAEDVHDFSWTASPLFTVIEDRWEHVRIRLLMQPDRVPTQAWRYMQSAKAALKYFNDWIGRYPYPTLTIVDPQWNALRAGGMEYPTFFTGLSLWHLPEGIRYMPEATVIHEFGHQYWYGLVANNEFEEAWLDEGINQYSETRIMNELYGPKTSLIDLQGLRIGDLESSYLSYAGMSNPRISPTFTNSWDFKAGGYGTLTYEKSALFLATLERMVGRPVMDEIMRTYFERWKFKHPCSRDFVDVVNEVVSRRLGDKFGKDMNWFFDQVLYGTGVCDYELTSITNMPVAAVSGIVDSAGIPEPARSDSNSQEGSQFDSRVLVSRLGEVRMPVDVLVHFAGGREVREHWDGVAQYREFAYRGNETISWASVDPGEILLIDVNRVNNSKAVAPSPLPFWKYTVKMLYWVQNILIGASPF